MKFSAFLSEPFGVDVLLFHHFWFLYLVKIYIFRNSNFFFGIGAKFLARPPSIGMLFAGCAFAKVPMFQFVLLAVVRKTLDDLMCLIETHFYRSDRHLHNSGDCGVTLLLSAQFPYPKRLPCLVPSSRRVQFPPGVVFSPLRVPGIFSVVLNAVEKYPEFFQQFRFLLPEVHDKETFMRKQS
ncbi:MAG: hypothetical protein A2X91_09800 [Deltaproteobacteria bacterium GWB2_65_81]|nr:MAG: hypothetical protein A2X91_09800 [Deltaproteobacteria bacterium GWB2_65_81]